MAYSIQRIGPEWSQRSQPPLPPPPQPVSPDEYRLRQFYGVLFHLTPRPYVTIALIAINVIVFLVMAVAAGGLLSPSEQALLRFGANYGPLTTSGQWWRLLTCMFIHIGIIHIGLNMFVFWQAGGFVERLLGSVGFLVLYIVSGLCASIASILWNPQVLSAGASGAVFGVYGGLLGFMALRRDSVPRAMLRSLVKGVLLFIGYNVIFGLTQRGIDMAAHAGGLLSGLCCGLIMSQPITSSLRTGRTWRNAVVAGLGISIVGAAVAWLPRSIDMPALLRRFNTTHQELLGEYGREAADVWGGQAGEGDLARLLQSGILPQWHQLQQQLQQADRQRLTADDHAMLERILAYMEARRQHWDMLQQALTRNDPNLLAEAQEAGQRADALMRGIGHQTEG